MINKISSFIISISLPVIILLTITQFFVMYDDFYYNQYIKNDVVNNTNIEISNLMKITDEIQDYLFDNRKDFIIYSTIGENKFIQVFNEREILHMEDVKELFVSGINLRNTLLIISFICILILYKKNKKKLYESFFISAIIYFSFIIIISILLWSNFNEYFNLFHEIFFSNDLWILNPETSVLINMVPLNFFINIVISIITVSSIIMIIIGIVGGYKR